MPEISRFFGIIIRMYFDEHNPPHFHAQYGKYSASFNIKTGQKMEGKFPKSGERIVNDWAGLNRKDLLENWSSIKKTGEFKKILGADK